jgi:hypothetical protein
LLSIHPNSCGKSETGEYATRQSFRHRQNADDGARLQPGEEIMKLFCKLNEQGRTIVQLRDGWIVKKE